MPVSMRISALPKAGGEGGALGGDGVVEAVFEAADEIDLAFAEEGPAFVADAFLGFIEAEEDFALHEDRRFGGVDVFGGLGLDVEEASAEGDDAARLVADGEHEAAPEAVVAASGFLVDGDEARFLDDFGGEAFFEGPGHGGVPGVGGVADLEALRQFAAEVAAFEVVAGSLGHFVLVEEFGPPGGDDFVEAEELLAHGAAVPAAAGLELVFFGDLDAGTLGQAAHRPHEVEVFVKHDEFEDVAPLLAAVAVEELLVGMDVEGGGLFPVEGA